MPGGTNPAEVTFVRGYALEQLGRTEEAIAAYLSIPDGRNEYYGTRATQRLSDLANNDKSRTLVKMRLNALTSEAKTALAAGQFEQARKAAQSSLRLTNDSQIRAESLKTLQTAYNALPVYRVPKFNRVSLLKSSASDPPEKSSPDAISDNLLMLGLYDEALPEILARTQNRTPDEDYTIATLSLRAGIPNRAVRFGEQTIKLHASAELVEPTATHPVPGSANLCFVTSQALSDVQEHLRSNDVRIEEGPVGRTGSKGPITSIYLRDPDGNLIEVARYDDE